MVVVAIIVIAFGRPTPANTAKVRFQPRAISCHCQRTPPRIVPGIELQLMMALGFLLCFDLWDQDVS